MTPHIVIVGGGLAGLVVAHTLASNMPVRITILEGAAQPGGRIRTDLVDGCLVEAGPDSFLSAKPHALSLCTDLGIADEVEGTIPRRTRGFIARNGRLHALPEGLTGLIPARLGALLRTSVLSPAGRARFAAELFLPPNNTPDDESVASFARRRFGVEAWQWLIEPLLGGIHGGDGEHLSVRATFPTLVAAERRAGSVLSGLSVARRPEPGAHTPFVAPRGGMGRLIEALRAHIPFDVQTDACVTSVSRSAGGWISNANGTEIECDAIVLAVPACHAAELLQDAAAPLAAVLAEIPFVSATVVNMAFDEDGLGYSFDGYGYLNPRASGRAVAACTWTTSKFEHRAPAGTVLLRCFLRGERWANPVETSDADLAEACRVELRELLGIRAEPRWLRSARWPAAMPQYTVGHLERMRRIDAALSDQPGLFLTGNSFRGVGISDTIAHARFVAERIIRAFNAA